MTTQEQAAAAIISMANRLTRRCRNLEQGFAASVVYSTWKDVCQKTEAWRIAQFFDAVADQTTFVLTPSFNGTVQRISEVRLFGTQTTPATPWDYFGRAMVPGLEWEFDNTLTVTVRTPAGDAQTNYARVTYVFDPTADDPVGVDPVTFKLWDNAIWNGCMTELLNMGNMQWFDKAGRQQQQHLRDYQKQLGKIRLDAERTCGRTTAQMMLTSPYRWA